MNRKNLIIALAITGSLASCQKEGTATAASTENKTNNTTSFTDKAWRIKSVITNPAVLDVDGDSKKDSEVISSLQYPERNKDIVFAADGKVWERCFNRSQTKRYLEKHKRCQCYYMDTGRRNNMQHPGKYRWQADETNA